MNTIGSCPQLTLTLESNWGGHCMQNAYQTLFSFPQRPCLNTCIQLEKKCLFAFSLEPKFKRKQPKKCQHAKDQFRDKIQTSHESRHAPYCYKRGLCQSLFCLMVGKLSKYSQMSLANRGNGQIDGYLA